MCNVIIGGYSRVGEHNTLQVGRKLAREHLCSLILIDMGGLGDQKDNL